MLNDDFSNSQYSETYEKIYYEYFGIVKKVVTKLMFENLDAVEDVMQEVFTKMFTSLSTYDPKRGSLTPWIIKIARSQTYEYYRRFGKLPIFIDDVTLLVDRTTTNEHRDILDRVDYSMDELDELSKNIYILKTVYRYTHKQIAEALNTTEDISKKKYRRASNIVTTKWREYEQE